MSIVKQRAWCRLAASAKGTFTHDGVNFVLTGMKVRHKFYDFDQLIKGHESDTLPVANPLCSHLLYNQRS